MAVLMRVGILFGQRFVAISSSVHFSRQKLALLPQGQGLKQLCVDFWRQTRHRFDLFPDLFTRRCLVLRSMDAESKKT